MTKYRIQVQYLPAHEKDNAATIDCESEEVLKAMIGLLDEWGSFKYLVFEKDKKTRSYLPMAIDNNSVSRKESD